MTKLANAFSLQMVDISKVGSMRWTPMTVEEVAATDFVSVVGHPDTASLLTSMLGKEVAFNRTSISLQEGESLIVAQVTGGRLPEGCTTLPEGVTLAFVKVELI